MTWGDDCDFEVRNYVVVLSMFRYLQQTSHQIVPRVESSYSVVHDNGREALWLCRPALCKALRNIPTMIKIAQYKE